MFTDRGARVVTVLLGEVKHGACRSSGGGGSEKPVVATAEQDSIDSAVSRSPESRW